MSRRTADAPVALRARDIADLAVTSGYPCISVLLPTSPAPRMTTADRARLDGLVAEVEAQLAEQRVTNRSVLLERLSDHVFRALEQPTDRALCLYVSRAVARTFRLPQPVAPRAVVESTFATRPLIAALHRMPPHVVLVLHPTCAHLYAAEDGGLRPVDHHEAVGAGRPVRVPGPGQPGAAAARTELMEGFLRRVDRMLGDYRAEHPSPLVLVGPPRLVDEFCVRSSHLERLAGRVDDRTCATALDLALASLTAVETYLRTRRADALALLEAAEAERPGDVATGIEACWRAVGPRRPEMLLVEENFIQPGTVQVEVHDLVDDLMEQVILLGGQLALVADGDLSAHDRIALVLRR